MKLKNGPKVGMVALGLALAGCGSQTTVYTEHYYETHVPQMKAMYKKCKSMTTMTHSQTLNCDAAQDAMTFWSTSSAIASGHPYND